MKRCHIIFAALCGTFVLCAYAPQSFGAKGVRRMLERRVHYKRVNPGPVQRPQTSNKRPVFHGSPKTTRQGKAGKHGHQGKSIHYSNKRPDQ